MGEGDCYFREKKVVEEGPEIAGDEAVVDDSVDEHQVLDEIPVGVRQFYFVKVLALENSNIDAMIEAEETIKKMNQDQILIAQKIRDRQMDFAELISKLDNLQYYENYDVYSLESYRRRMNFLYLSLDKLTSANKACKGKPTNSCLSGGKVDKQKLSCLMLHGCKNMADERKLLREVNARQEKDGGLTVDEVDSPIEPLIKGYRYKQIDIQIALALGGEEAIGDFVVEGKMWNSLGLKKAIQEELQEVYENSDELRKRQARVRTKIRKTKKKLEKVEKDIGSLQKHLIYTNRRKDEAYDTILKLKKQYGDEICCR